MAIGFIPSRIITADSRRAVVLYACHFVSVGAILAFSKRMQSVVSCSWPPAASLQSSSSWAASPGRALCTASRP